MVLWILCLKLWWLLLPLSVFGHPLFSVEDKETAVSERLRPRDGGAILDLDHRSTADMTERAIDTSSTEPRLKAPPNHEYDILLLANLQPEPSLNETVLLPASSTMPGPLQNATLGTYGSYKDLGERIEFDFEYPPFTRKKIIVRFPPSLPCSNATAEPRMGRLTECVGGSREYGHGKYRDTNIRRGHGVSHRRLHRKLRRRYENRCESYGGERLPRNYRCAGPGIGFCIPDGRPAPAVPQTFNRTMAFIPMEA